MTTEISTEKKFPNVSDMKEIIRKNIEDSAEENQEKKKVFLENLKYCTDLYYDSLLNNVYAAVDYMKAGGNTHDCVYVTVPTKRIKWGSEEDKFIPWHWIHYGFPDRKSRGWYKRDTKFWEEGEMVFRRIQKLCYEHGYYLYDISNPEKGNKTFLKLSIKREEMFESEELWHNFNKILGI